MFNDLKPNLKELFILLRETVFIKPANAGDKSSIPDPGRSHMPPATRPMNQNCRACALEPRSSTTEPMCCSYRSLRVLEPALHNKRRHCNERSEDQN